MSVVEALEAVGLRDSLFEFNNSLRKTYDTQYICK